MSKLVTVVGATGAQGGSIVSSLLKDPSYKVRALTRNPQSTAGQALAARGAEVVKADINDLASLTAAFKGSYAVFAVTDFFEPFASNGPEKAIEIEATQGINLAKAAEATPTLQHYIWSTLPNGTKLTNGKWNIPHFVAKNRVDAYIRSQPALLAKTTFLWVTYYAQNYVFPMFTPIKVPSAGGKWVQLGVTEPNVPVKTIGDSRINVGIFAKAALDQPQRSREGRIVLAAVEDTTVRDMLKLWARVNGEEAEYVAVSDEAYNTVWPAWGKEMGDMMRMWEEVREHSWDSEFEVLTKEHLGVTGLVGLEKSLTGLTF